MTTTVTIQPAGHRVKVTKNHGANGEIDRQEEEFLNPGDPAKAFYVHSTMSLDICEVSVEEVAKAEEAAGGYAVDAED